MTSDRDRPTVPARAPFGVFTPLQPGQCSQVRTMSRDGTSSTLVLEVPFRLEAPNWTPDGGTLVVNGGGKLFALRLSDATLTEIPVDGVDDANNDHVLSCDGATIYLSAAGAIYSVPLAGGTPSRLSPEGSDAYYLHGISPDGARLACTVKCHGRPDAPWALHLLPAAGGAPTALLAGMPPVDGPEWSPDGGWIWFNGELEADYPGHAQIFRFRPDGSGLERMVTSATADWFPHPSPDGREVLFLSYPEGTRGHPADEPVHLRLLDLATGQSRTMASLLGGQGTINVNSWSPDSTHFAFVSYPVKA